MFRCTAALGLAVSRKPARYRHHRHKSDSLGALIAKFLDPAIDLSPAGIDHSMGTVFEELVRKFNEDSNEEAREHWTPRDPVRLMANLIFLPIADNIRLRRRRHAHRR
jgi:type I restriction-modification system DNA methylase subunit